MAHPFPMPEKLPSADDSNVVLSLSGGKDSMATGLMLKELGIPFQCIFMDTGWEHVSLYDYIEQLQETEVLGPITVLKARAADRNQKRSLYPLAQPEREEVALAVEDRLGRESPMVRLVLTKLMFPSLKRRFCTGDLKIKPAAIFFHKLEVACRRAGDDRLPLNVVGIRAEESARRSRMTEWDHSADLHTDVWRPILRWTMDDIVAIHQRHGLRPCRLYLAGARRVGCWPCIFSRKREIRLVSDLNPMRIDALEFFETEVNRLLAAENRARSSIAAWFQAATRNAEGARPCTPIRQVVEWSHTRRGGSQIELFAPPEAEAGCMRWGMCDTGHFSEPVKPKKRKKRKPARQLLDHDDEQLGLFGDPTDVEEG